MRAVDHRWALVLILVANVVTAGAIAVWAIRRPILRIRVMAALALWAVVASLQQAVSDHFNPLSLLLTSVLLMSMAVYGALNRTRPRQ